MTHYTVHTRSHFATYAPLGVYASRKEAMDALAAEVAKGHIASAWIRFFDDTMLIYSWNHERDSVAEARSAAASVL